MMDSQDKAPVEGTPVEENNVVETSNETVETPVAEEPKQEGNTEAATPVEEPVAEEAPVEEPVAEEIPAEEPMAEEVPAEEPVAEEISAEELTSRCHDGLKIVVDDLEKAAALLTEKGFSDLKVKRTSLLLRDGIERAAEINTLLVSNGLSVSELSVHSNGFEEYFIKRLGH